MSEVPSDFQSQWLALKAEMKTFLRSLDLQKGLLIPTFFSWMMYPLLLTIVAGSFFKLAFALTFAASFVLFALSRKFNRFAFSKSLLVIFALWFLYFASLAFSTLMSGDRSSIQQLIILFYKVLFFFFLLFSMKESFLQKSFQLYTAFMLIVLSCALVTVVISILGVPPFLKVDTGARVFEFYFFSYYFPEPAIIYKIPIARIQGLADEPGTFGFALVPAFYWLLFVSKSRLRLLFVSVGLILCLAIGAVASMLLTLPALLIKSPLRSRVLKYHLLVILGSGLLQVVSTLSHNANPAIRYIYGQSYKSPFAKDVEIVPQTMVNRTPPQPGVTPPPRVFEIGKSLPVFGKANSMDERAQCVVDAFRYLSGHPFGIGASNANKAIEGSTAIGYLTAAVEAGAVGTLFYFAMLALLACLALKHVLMGLKNQKYTQVAVTASLFVILTMGMQRTQGDITLWYMWIFALFVFQLNPPKSLAASA